MKQKRQPSITTVHKREMKEALSNCNTTLRVIQVSLEHMYALGVRHGLETAYNLGGIDKAHKQQRDAREEEKAIQKESRGKRK